MKKLLLSSIVLFLFSASILIFQASCRKEANAGLPDQTTADASNKVILYTTYSYTNATSTISYWMANLDGTKKEIPIILPSNLELSDDKSGALIDDGKTLIFLVNEVEKTNDATVYHIYSCSIDGSNLKKVLDGTEHAKANRYTNLVGIF